MQNHSQQQPKMHHRHQHPSHPGSPPTYTRGALPLLPANLSTPADMWICECGSENMDWYDACPNCGRMKSNATTYTPPASDCAHIHSHHHPHLPGPDAFMPTTTPAPEPSDIWVCECGFENLTWCEQCPNCGRMKDSMDMIATMDVEGQEYAGQFLPTVFGGAGSAAPGAWTCESCGSANSDFFEACGACGAEK